VLLDGLPVRGDVVTGAPSLKSADPLMNPEIVLSLFNVHFSIVATPRGAIGTFAFATGAGLAAGAGAA